MNELYKVFSLGFALLAGLWVPLLLMDWAQGVAPGLGGVVIGGVIAICVVVLLCFLFMIFLGDDER